jgi:hypothetical protein
MASGRSFDIGHSVMIKVLKSGVLVVKPTSETPEIPDERESVSLMLAESVSNLDAPIRRSTND